MVTKNSPNSYVGIRESNLLPKAIAPANITANTTTEATLVAGATNVQIHVLGLKVTSGADNPFTLGSKIGTTTTTIGAKYDNIDGVPQIWPPVPSVDMAWFKLPVGASLVVSQDAATVQNYDLMYCYKVANA